MKKLRKRLQRMKSCDYWRIAYRKRNSMGNLLHEERIEGFRLLPQKRFVTQADPFLFTHQGKTWLFYEKQNLTDMKGTLWCQNLDEPEEKPVPVLEEPFHLSYPQVFQYGKYTYLLPETRNAGRLRLYKCIQFPGKWELVDTLMELAAVDTTLLQKDAQEYYAFAYVENRLEIYLWKVNKERFCVQEAERIFVSEPSKKLRPGGKLFFEEGVWYRPAQNCTDYYGQELIFYQLERITEGKLKEQEYGRLSPAQLALPGVNGVGIHTYNRNEDYEVIDILHREISLFTILKKLQWKLRGSRG